MAKATVTGSITTRRISTEGEIDITNVSTLRATVDTLLGSNTINYDIYIDFTNTSYIDSAVLELVISTRNKLAKLGKRLGVVVYPKSQPEHVLKMCQFDTILDLWMSDELPAALTDTASCG